MGANMYRSLAVTSDTHSIIAAGQVPSGRLRPTTRHGSCVYGMQEVRGSNPRSSTPRSE